MKPLTGDAIRASIVNAHDDGEVQRMPLPGLHEVLWHDREYLGWRDPRSPSRGYLVHWAEHQPIGIVLTASESRLRPGIPAMCSLCHTQQPGGQVSLFTAPRAGEAGRHGSTLGTYICSDLACSLLIRIVPSAAHPDPSIVIAERAARLLERVTAFTAGVLGSR